MNTSLNFFPDIHKLTLAEFNSIPHAEAARQVKFFDILFNEVICKQLLPKAIGPFSSMFAFAWEPDQHRAAYAEIQIQLKSGFFDARHTAHDINQNADMFDPLYTVDCSAFAKRLSSSTHVQLFCRYGLLAEVFSRRCEEVEFSFVPKSETTLALPSWARFHLTTTFGHYSTVPDILAALISDGLDLTALQPFFELPG